MQEITITRKFNYNGIDLADPGIELSVDEVRLFYSTQFAELNTAMVTGPETNAGVRTYKFARAAGAKGASGVASSNLAYVKAAARGLVPDDLQVVPSPEKATGKSLQEMLNALEDVVRGNVDGPSAPMMIPSQAHGLYG